MKVTKDSAHKTIRTYLPHVRSGLLRGADCRCPVRKADAHRLVDVQPATRSCCQPSAGVDVKKSVTDIFAT